ncbi:hypothetical protein SNOG_11595 [Parastagonospora nodorum SN15]|uniref:Uncharacterized protein n=1 Tax=Phaeosphaeria nodorum (strain SN15 / ATCC MYA-4574 / FGSC 10173) TaxID=321614 RepID=Q0U9G9_PHANO|nr:hypothetical protein SNOG_11595 [Parastagonospora nodorum SN15]EAT81303.1 hypothetical protein SNOG_11595 [Parastagonospora nodorum SN15]
MARVPVASYESWGSLPDIPVFSKTLAAEAKMAERIIHGAVVDAVGFARAEAGEPV